jgi:hypothetical protein
MAVRRSFRERQTHVPTWVDIYRHAEALMLMGRRTYLWKQVCLQPGPGRLLLHHGKPANPRTGLRGLAQSASMEALFLLVSVSVFNRTLAKYLSHNRGHLASCSDQSHSSDTVVFRQIDKDQFQALPRLTTISPADRVPCRGQLFSIVLFMPTDI